jgi:hypothetical protein
MYVTEVGNSAACGGLITTRGSIDSATLIGFQRRRSIGLVV